MSRRHGAARLVVWLALVMLLGGSTGAFATLLHESCADGCPDGEEDGRCRDLGSCCLCCLNARPMVAARTLIVPSPGSVAIFNSFSERATTPSDPREILHVPRSIPG